jgi:hypothetical protein
VVGVELGDMNSGGLRRKGTGKFSRLSTPFLDSLWGMGKKSTAVTMVCLSWLGKASIAGGDGNLRRPCVGMGGKWSRGGRNSARVRPGDFIGRRNKPRHAVG